MAETARERAFAEMAYCEAVLAKGGLSVLSETLRGVEAIGAWDHYPPGDVFDPVFHDALVDQPTEGVEEPQIAQVLQFGYKVGDKVIRAAQVVVATPA